MSLKKITAACMAGLMALSLTACRGTPAETAEITPPALIDAELRIDYTEDPAVLEHVETLQASFEDPTETDASDFTMEETDGGLIVKSYDGSAARVRIPAQVGGVAVVAIADAAFAGKEALTSLYIPDSIRTLGSGILSGASNLQALRTPLLGKSATDTEPYLGYLFFSPSEQSSTADYRDNPICVPASLKYLEIGGMKNLPAYALYDCNKLECLRLSETVETVGAFALYNCKSLLAVNVDGLMSLDTYALADCSALTRLDFGTRLTKIGFAALEGCGGLRRMTLPFIGGSATENTYLSYLFGAADVEFSKGYIPPYLFEITVTAATSLDDCAFYECHTLMHVKLPETLAQIGTRAFAGCVRLEEIVFSTALQRIGENAFFGCYNLKTVIFAENGTLNSMGVNAFYNCVSLAAVSLPLSLKVLPASAFAGCRSLTEVDLGGVESVGKNAFRNCSLLAVVKSGGGVKLEKGNDALKKLLK